MTPYLRHILLSTDWAKLMRLNRHKAKIRFKSDSCRILIDFLDLISAVRFNRRDDDSIRNRDRFQI